jgi:hypothetical protein
MIPEVGWRAGNGKREAGSGKRETGNGKRETGSGGEETLTLTLSLGRGNAPPTVAKDIERSAAQSPLPWERQPKAERETEKSIILANRTAHGC